MHEDAMRLLTCPEPLGSSSNVAERLPGRGPAGAEDYKLGCRRILVCADRPLVVGAWCALIRRISPHIDVQSHLFAVHEQAKDLNIDVAEIIIYMLSPDESMRNADIARLKGLQGAVKAIPIVCVTDRPRELDVVNLLRNGVRGVITTSMNAPALVHILNFILAGGIFVPDAILGEWRALTSTGNDLPDTEAGSTKEREVKAGSGIQFTPREHDVLEMLRRGLQNKVIAHELGMKESTVKIHVRHIMRKLAVRSRAQVAVYAEQRMRGAGSSP